MGLRADHFPIWARATGQWAGGVGGSVLRHRGDKTAAPAPTALWWETTFGVVRNGRPTNGGWSFCPVLPFPRTVSVEEDSRLRIGNSTLSTGRIANFARRILPSPVAVEFGGG